MKTAMITGASRGIGRAAALCLAEKGYSIAAIYNNSEDNAKSLIKELSQYEVPAEIFKCNISDSRQVNETYSKICGDLGAPQILVNNAGIAQQKLFTDISDDDWRKMIDVNLSGTFFCCRAAVPFMISCKFGRIINISSIWGLRGASCEVHYSAAKAGVIGLTKALAKELGPSGITVNCIAPGVIDTDMNSALSRETLAALCEETPLCRLGAPQDIAETIAFLASDKASFITGQVLSVDGGIAV